jgi:hypothetical protein
MIARVFVASLLFLQAASAQQLLNDQTRVEQPAAQNTNNKTQEQRPEVAPQPIIVNVAAPEKTDQDRENEAKERRQKSELDSKLTEYTGELAFFTKGLFVATVVLAIATVALGVFAFLQSRDMKASIRVAAKGARAAGEAANAAHAQVELTDIHFKRLERPYVYIYGVHRFIAGAENAGAQYTVANFGKTPAQVTVLAAGISFAAEPLDNLIVDYRDDPEHPLLVEPVLSPGDMHQRLYLKAPDNLEFGHYQTGAGNVLIDKPRLNPGESAFVWIQISYRGPSGDGYMTSACWRYDGLTDRLVKWGGENYNYMI